MSNQRLWLSDDEYGWHPYSVWCFNHTWLQVKLWPFQKKSFPTLSWELGGFAGEQEKCIINWESLQVFLDTVILDFSTLMVTVYREVWYPSEVCHDDERFVHCTSKWTRHIWVLQCGVHRLQRGAGRQMTKECGGQHDKKREYVLIAQSTSW